MRPPLAPPFRFNLLALVSRIQKLPGAVDGVVVSIPFVSVTIKPLDIERKVAREVVIRMADRRILNAWECCDGCIENALESLQEIRGLLVDKQAELADRTDCPLYLLLELMAEALRQFFTLEERLSLAGRDRQGYFAALEMLRAHLHRVLLQIAKVADVKIPKNSDHMRYDKDWQLEAYEQPEASLPE